MADIKHTMLVDIHGFLLNQITINDQTRDLYDFVTKNIRFSYNRFISSTLKSHIIN